MLMCKYAFHHRYTDDLARANTDRERKEKDWTEARAELTKERARVDELRYTSEHKMSELRAAVRKAEESVSDLRTDKIRLEADCKAAQERVTLLERQLESAEARFRDALLYQQRAADTGLADQVRFKLQDYRDEPETYDRMYTKMVQARSLGGIVVTTPSAIKSIVNKYIELLNVIASVEDTSLLKGEVPDPDVERAQRYDKRYKLNRSTKRRYSLKNTNDTADAIARVMNLWSERERGILLLDEVDMLLHPLRSELNFPIGEKFPLQPSPTRWDLPIHLLDAIFFAEAGLQLRGEAPGRGDVPLHGRVVRATRPSVPRRPPEAGLRTARSQRPPRHARPGPSRSSRRSP